MRLRNYKRVTAPALRQREGEEEIDDHVQIQELLWEREDRTQEKPVEQQLPGTEPYGTEDLVEALEEGVDCVPPTAPSPEEG